ncbi:MAG: HD-GYP domain-containing protein [Bryobacter sp.]|nr:HD-GYP domain-containing protein [Bryobacter sp.]
MQGFTMRGSLAQRAFLLTVAPVLAVLLGSFVALDWQVRQQAKQDLSATLARTQTLVQAQRQEGEKRLRQSLTILAESAGLKAAMSLERELAQTGAMAEASVARQIQATLLAQLRDLQQLLPYEVFVLANNEGKVLAALPQVEDFRPAAVLLRAGEKREFFEMITVPVNRGLENLGFVAVGTRVDLSRSPAALLQGGRVVAASLPGLAGLESTLAAEPGEIEVGGKNYVAGYERRGDYLWAEFREVDSAVAPALAAQRTVLASTIAVALGLCLLLSLWGTRSMAQPLSRLTEVLAAASREGKLPREFPGDGNVREITQLVRSFEEAARAVNASQQALEEAYVNFMGALAEALDARDPYTAGHSRRVADYSLRIARAMGMGEEEMETLRIGAMLHDIGKIGVPDRILHKHEKLTDEEFAIIQQHPVTGKRILERIGRFEQYWPVVELHHENHDGSGYPHGLQGEEIPLAARIVHVADAYDAMTSDRPYRQRMPEEKVRRILRECAGTQFDPVVTEVFLNIRIEVLTAISEDLEKLSHAITVFQDPANLPASAGAGEHGEGAGGERGPALSGPDLSQRLV